VLLEGVLSVLRRAPRRGGVVWNLDTHGWMDSHLAGRLAEAKAKGCFAFAWEATNQIWPTP
jgi:hypothetical protein